MDLFNAIESKDTISDVKQDTLLLFDLNYLLYKSFYSHKDLVFEDKSTGGLFGFVKQFCKYVNTYDPKHVVVCTDSPPYLRKNDYYEYKSNRKKSDSDSIKKLEENRNHIINFLKVLNISLWKQDGYEADDLICWGVNKYKNDYDKIIIISTDDDLYQVLNDKTYLAKQKNVLYSLQDFKKEFDDISTEQWCRLLSLSGSHNGVPGIPKIGKKKALKIVKDEAIWEKNYLEYKNLIDLYLKVIKLPYDNKIKDFEINKPKYEYLALKGFLSTYGITLFSNFKEALGKLCKG